MDYKEKLRLAKEALESGSYDKDTIEYIFPELKESEDERIRQKLIDYCYCSHITDTFNGIPWENVRAWLEKQGNPTEDELEALRMAAYEPTKNWSEKLQSLYEKLTHCEQKPVIEMKTPEESLGIDSDTYNKIVDECVYGEQKSADVEEVNFFDDFRKTDSEVEPKFHEGEWITNGDYTWQIVEIKPLDYILQSQDGNVVDDTISHVDEQFHSFTIQDAKDGDVLAAHECYVIFKEIDGLNIKCYCTYHYMGCNPKFYVDTLQNKNAFYPATKEQRDLLFQKMKESGYEWDSEKLELIKIKQNVTSKFKIGDNIEPIDSCLGSPRTIYKICDGWYETNQGTLNFEYENNWRLIEQKPAWSEEDELMLVSIIQTLKLTNGAAQMKIDWLKSLKERIPPKSTWNEEDESMLNFVKVVLNKHKNDAFFDKFETTLNDCLTWFRNIKSRVGCEVNCTTTWKPSDEQMDELRKYSDNVVLRNLYYNLKKLKVE